MRHSPDIQIVEAGPQHIPVIHGMIDDLATHLQLGHERVATEQDLHNALFGPQPQAEVVLAYVDEAATGFALFYNNYSTFRGRCGLHLEDLYVRPAWRAHGIGKRLPFMKRWVPLPGRNGRYSVCAAIRCKLWRMRHSAESCCSFES